MKKNPVDDRIDPNGTDNEDAQKEVCPWCHGTDPAFPYVMTDAEREEELAGLKKCNPPEIVDAFRRDSRSSEKCCLTCWMMTWFAFEDHWKHPDPPTAEEKAKRNRFMQELIEGIEKAGFVHTSIPHIPRKRKRYSADELN